MTQSHSRLRNAASRPATRRGLLLAGASLFVLAAAQATPAQAGSLKAALSAAQVSHAAAAAAVATAANRTAGTISRTANANLTASLNSLKAALAAQKAMAGVHSSFNGLGPGALQPVANPNTAADGLTDWTGADLPTEAVTGDHHDVTVKQTQSRAVLSWESFNVGSDTTLTFDQQGNASWIALNRVVGDTAAPSQILGQVKADGQVLVINQNGIVFGAGAQVNVHSLIASTAEIGRSFGDERDSFNNPIAMTVAQRNAEFLEYGLTGYAGSHASKAISSSESHATFSGTTSGYDADTAIHDSNKDWYYNYRNAAVTVEAGAALTAKDGGMVALIAPTVTNAGHLSAADGQVSLIGLSGRTGRRTTSTQWVSLNPSDGSASALDPNIRGFLPVTDSGTASLDDDHTVTSLVRNSGVIEAERGYVSLGAQVWDQSSEGLLSNDGTVVNTGILHASTGVSANGVIDLHGKDITLGGGSLLLIDADGRGDVIAQGKGTPSDFKTSKVRIGSDISDVVLEGGARIVVPSGDVVIGVASGINRPEVEGSILVKGGALIDVSGLKDVYVPMSHYNLKIALYGNELADSGGYQDSFLYGKEVWIDARRSGVREDGVAWVGSPLISAAAYYEAVGITAPEILTRGGNVTLRARHGKTTALSPTNESHVTVAEGAVVDMSGGWVTYQGGTVKTSQLVNGAGHVVDIGNANPLTDTYVAVHGGVTRTSDKWGTVETWKTLGGGTYGTLTEAAYTEGRDAGTLTLRSPMVTFEGDLDATAHAGLKQIAEGKAGTGSSGVFGDGRRVQGAKTEVPAGGMMFVEANGAIRVEHGAGTAEEKTVVLSDALLSDSGLSQVSLWSSGAITVAEDATVALQPGGVFDALAGRSVTIAGTVSAPAGAIILETYAGAVGSIFYTADDARVKGAFDITVTGTLSVAGLWVNDLGKAGTDLGGGAWLDGGSITMVSADSLGVGSTVTKSDSSSYDPDVTTTTDISGSILLADAKLIDLSGGGRVTVDGTLDLLGKGGDLSLINQTAFHNGTAITTDAKRVSSGTLYGTLSGFRTRYTYRVNNHDYPGAIQINPDAVTSTVQFDADTIRAAGFSGGGTFTLWAPDIKFGSGSVDDTATATAIPLDFFSTAGFGAYSLTSNKTELIDNTFVDTNGNSLGGKNALLQTQTFRVRDGEILSLTQSLLPTHLTDAQRATLLGLETGGDVGSVLTASVPTEAWDQKAVDLTLDGMVELVVEAGGTITGAPGATLTVAKLKNQGTIRLPGGHLRQRQTVVKGSAGLAMRTLGDLFTVEADGTIVETKVSRMDGTTNGQLAGDHTIYRLGEMDEDAGIVLAEGSVTDLSGTSVHNPYALDPRGGRLTTGRVYDGGTITFGVSVNGLEFYRPSRASVNMLEAKAARVERSLTIAGGATVDLSGTTDTYQETVAGRGVVSRAVWSDGGAIATPNAFVISSDALITAQGGTLDARGGTLELADVILTQDTADAPRELSADQVMASGFSTLSVLRSLGSDGDVSLTLDRALYVTSRPMSIADAVSGGAMRVSIGAGGDLDITAPYIGLISRQDTLADATGTGGHAVRLHATRAFDITGAVGFTDAISSVALISDGDLRLIGVADPEVVYEGTGTNTALTGTLSVAGDLSLTAAQVYPTTDTIFTIGSRAGDGSVTFARSTQALPDAPYSAGGDLTVTAGTIVQGGVLRVPMGRLTLTATDTLTLTDGSYTEVSANGLIIPYGTTTDRKEWYFTPTGGSALTKLPEKVMTLSGEVIDMAAGAVVNVAGGGDLTAYEFAAGTGGSRDVLRNTNPDSYTSTTGCTYRGCAPVYAIVPGLSDQAVSAYDPVYSADYAALSSVSGAGRRVRLDLGEGLRWYTLLPARYATLPGGMLVVQQAENRTSLGVGATARRADGTLVAAGVYGDALAGTAETAIHLFAVQGHDVYTKYSSISLTSGNTYFSALAAKKGIAAPRLAEDAGRLALNATAKLIIDTVVRGAAGPDGRGAQVDVGGSAIRIVSALPSDISGALYVTADSLTNLGAESLLVGATRTEQADGTTRLNVTAGSLTVDNDAEHALKAAEIVLASTGTLTVGDGAAIAATGTLSDTNTAAYVLSGSSGTGALLRVANGAERLTSRANFDAGATLTVGAATLSGTAMLFDSSGAAFLAAGMTIHDAATVALGAGRIGLGMDPEGYGGVVLTEGLRTLLTQTGGALTLRSQSSIDFADGTYAFGDIRLDAATLSGTEGGAVTLSGDTVTLGNVGAEGTVCSDCTGNGGSLSIEAREILFAGGAMATQATVTTNAATAKLRHDTTIILPKGTLTSSGTLDRDTPITVSAGTVIDLAAGTGLLTDASGPLAAGSEIAAANLGLTLASGASITFTETTTTTDSGGHTNTRDAGKAYTLGQDVIVTVPSGSALVLETDVATVGTDFFGGGVSLTAAEGIFATGVKGGLDTGGGALTLHTPYLGDRAAPKTGGGTGSPGLTLTTRGTLHIDAAGAAAVDRAALGGIPGAGLSLHGDAVTIAGTTVHATAGTVTVSAESSLALTDGAVVEAPGYAATFGDTTDSTIQNAPGGRVRLIAAAGDIGLDAGTLVSVGGGAGDAGRLEISAAQGAIALDGTLDGRGAADGAGGILAVETFGAVDLTDLNGRAGADGFTGGFEVHTHSGDLVLDAGQTLRSGAVRLVADGGLVSIGGTIDTSGVNGGDIGLYGSDGVTLTETARLDARSTGYAQTDPRRAHAGDVTLGTDFRAGTTSTAADGVIGGTSGTITLAQGAVIDLSVANADNRVIKLDNDEGYHYVAADTAGTLTLRAPVIDTGTGPQTVDIHVASAETVSGAKSVVVEGFRRWDLAQVAASGDYAGVTVDAATGTVTLDARTDLDTANDDGTRTTVGGVNFLGDEGAGTLSDFVQHFDISAAEGGLGGLTYRARPGLDLAYDGNVTLASTWNFGAGVVDVDAAVAAGAMAEIDGSASVVAGREGELLGRFTRMLYRTGGSALGEAPTLTLRAGGNLHLDGSLTDGFFQFGDPDGPGVASFGIKPDVHAGLQMELLDPLPFPTSVWQEFFIDFYAYIDSNIEVFASGAGGAAYNNQGNSVSAETAGDTLSNMVPVSTACDTAACSGGKEITTTSYGLIAGADVTRDGGGLRVSVEPTGTRAGRMSTLSILGSETREATRGTPRYRIRLPTAYTIGTISGGGYGTIDGPRWEGGWGDADAFVDDFAQIVEDLAPYYEGKEYDFGFLKVPYAVPQDGGTTLNLGYKFAGGEVAAAVAAFKAEAEAGSNPILAALIDRYGAVSIQTTGSIKVRGPNAVVAYFMTHYDFANAFVNDVNQYAANHSGSTSPFPSPGSYTLTTHNMIRTGTGTITLAAAGDVDLTGGAGRARYEDAVAVYTTGVQAGTGTVSARDVATGRMASVDLGAHRGRAGLYLNGGGDIALTAGRDVLGRSVTYLTPEYSDGKEFNGAGLQWFVRADLTKDDFASPTVWADQELDLAGFTTGVGALAGGDVTVTAGRDVDDLAVAATPAIRTVDVTLDPGTEAETTALGIEVLGDSTVALTAGRDLRGGLAYVTSGRLSLDAGRAITDAGWSPWGSVYEDKEQILPRLRVLNATAEARARGAVALTWDDTLPWSRFSEANWYGPRAALSVVANGDIAMTVQSHTTGQVLVALPGSVTLAALTGDLSFAGRGLFLRPAPDGQLTLLAGGRIGGAERTVIVMDDADPANLPSPFHTGKSRGITFPVVVSSTTEAERRFYHNRHLTHAGDIHPVQVMAGGDISTLTLSLPKQARVVAGGDIVDMMLFGQNVSATDITRVAAAGAITATSTLVGTKVRLGGNTFVIGGPGDLVLEAGGDIGPFLNSATFEAGYKKDSDNSPITELQTLGGGVLSVGYDWNPWLKPAVTEAGRGANLTVMFGLGGTGPDYAALADAYVDPANAGALVDGDGYADDLVAWLEARYKRSGLSEAEAYAVFQALSPVERQLFLRSEVYFNELKQPAVPDGDSYQKYSRGYRAVNTLFPAAHGYTVNGMQGGAVDSDRVRLGDLDLRLAAVQTARGGDVRILGPGGDVLAGSVVRTSAQAERRSYDFWLYTGGIGGGVKDDALSIPTGLEGILTLRGGTIETFTDGSLILNQSRAFTQKGGDIVMWSSNGDLNAGEGAKTTITYAPRAVRFDWNAYGEVDEANTVAGAGIASFGETGAGRSSDVYLMAPRGTVDAGDAGIRVAGNISILAYEVRNADNIQVSGDSFGVPVVVGPNVGALTAASDSAGKASDAANQAARASRQATRRDSDLPSIITFQVIGYGGGAGNGDRGRGTGDDGRRAQTSQRPAPVPVYDPEGAVRFSAPDDGAAERS